jgi:O-acetyl-ADP-ribose deacetylase (regulator of RNase III)
MDSLSLPPLGFGVGAVDAEEYATMMIIVLTDHLQEGVPPSEIVIVVEASYDEELLRRLLAVVDLA